MSIGKKSLISEGFTLIELLVIVSILSFLAVMTLSSMASARIKARDVQRASDLSVIQRALEMYALDHGNTFPDCGGLCNIDFGVNAYAFNFNNVADKLRSEKYLSQSFMNERHDRKSFSFKRLLHEALASAMPEYPLASGAKNQDPKYPGKFYEYTVNSSKTNYRIRALMENPHNSKLFNGLQGVYGYDPNGCNSSSGYFCLGSVSYSFP